MITRSYNPIERGLPAIWLDQPIRSPDQVRRLLRQLHEYPEGDGPVDIVISGGGGSCALGLEIYSILREFPRPKRATIFDAPSISGLIAMAGDHRRIVEGGNLFLHGAGYSRADLLNEAPMGHLLAETLRSLARNCDATDAIHCEIFARRTGLEPHVIARLRGAETTLDAAAAVQLGFAHEIIMG